ncbi:MAG TPA: Panacea domain-containing protein [Gallionellaceae bacterium]
MPVHVKHFDRDKALELVVFIAKHLQNATLHSISKMLYLADKLHLQEYGRLICGDRYIAMEYGPVPSAIYDMMKVADKRKSIDVDWDELIQESLGVIHGRDVFAKRDCNLNLVAESELECIQQAIAVYGGKTFGELVDITHDGAWKSVVENEPIPVDAIVAVLPNADEVAEYMHAR